MKNTKDVQGSVPCDFPTGVPVGYVAILRCGVCSCFSMVRAKAVPGVCRLADRLGRDGLVVQGDGAPPGECPLREGPYTLYIPEEP